MERRILKRLAKTFFPQQCGWQEETCLLATGITIVTGYDEIDDGKDRWLTSLSGSFPTQGNSS